MTPFILGTLLGLFLMWLLYTGKRRHIKIVDEEKQLLEQKSQIVVEFMHNMVEAISEAADREAMFQRIIHAAVLSTGATSACIFERQPDDTLRGVAVEGLFPPQRKLPEAISSKLTTRTQFIENILKSETYRMGEGLIGQVGKSRRAQLIGDALSDPRVVRHEDAALQVRSIIVAPVLFQDRLLAVLAVANPADELAFTETDFSLVESLAEQVGLAVHNSDAMQLQIEKNKLDLDIELASNIQSLLLPSHYPTEPRLDFATEYSAAQKIGGDLYDVFKIDDSRVGLAVADVSGKGISASLLMAICQTHLRHLSREARSPSAVLSAINRELQASMRRDMFITIVYAVVDLEAETLTLARAGHELPLFYKGSAGPSDGESTPVEAVSSEGMALGMVPPEIFDAVIADVTVPFKPGDCLLLYTDGVTESQNGAGEEYSKERLMDNLRTFGGGNMQGLLDQVIESVNRFAGSSGQADDFTLAAVRRN